MLTYQAHLVLMAEVESRTVSLYEIKQSVVGEQRLLLVPRGNDSCSRQNGADRQMSQTILSIMSSN